MECILAQHGVYNALVLFTKAEDYLDKNLLLSFLEPGSEITFDVSGHLEGVSPMQLTPLQYWTQIVEFLSGFTATQHHIGNPTIDVSDDLARARISVEVIAYIASCGYVLQGTHTAGLQATVTEDQLTIRARKSNVNAWPQEFGLHRLLQAPTVGGPSRLHCPAHGYAFEQYQAAQPCLDHKAHPPLENAPRVPQDLLEGASDDSAI